MFSKLGQTVSIVADIGLSAVNVSSTEISSPIDKKAQVRWQLVYFFKGEWDQKLLSPC